MYISRLQCRPDYQTYDYLKGSVHVNRAWQHFVEFVDVVKATKRLSHVTRSGCASTISIVRPKKEEKKNKTNAKKHIDFAQTRKKIYH